MDVADLSLNIEELIVTLREEFVNTDLYPINTTAFLYQKHIGEWVMCCCPFHPETNPSFGISTVPPYHVNCFYCGYLGTVDRMIEKLFGLKRGQGICKLTAGYIIDESRKMFDVEEIIDGGRNGEIPCLPESYINKFELVADRSSEEAVKAYEYLSSRGLSEKTMRVYDIRVDGKYILFPQRDRRGRLRFVQRRIAEKTNKKDRRFYNELVTTKKDILFGLHLIDRLKFTPHRISRVAIVESPIDVMSCFEVGIPAIGLNGKILYPPQIREMQLAGIDTVDIFTDADDAGREAARKIASKLAKSGFRINMVVYPERGDGQKDPNDLLVAGKLLNVRTIPSTIY